MRQRNKILFKFFTIFLILLLSCGFASAVSDFDDSDSISIIDNDGPLLSDDIISDDENLENLQNYDDFAEKNSSKDVSNSLSSPVNGNTFKDIQTAIDNSEDGDIIELNGTYVGNGSCINITKNLIIDGNFETILDAKNKSGIFNVKSTDVILKNLKFYNANVPKYGAAVNGGGTVINCTFVNNTAGGVYGSIDAFWSTGGVVYLGTINSSVIDCTFINNTDKADGGAIYCDAAGCSIVNCTFINNTAKEYGGAIYLGGGHDGGAGYLNTYDCFVLDCTFINNKAVFGGAICYSGSGSVLNCTFINNSAVFGTSIWVYNNYYPVYGLDVKDLLIKECNFISNDDRPAISNYKINGEPLSGLCIISDSNFTNEFKGKYYAIYNEGKLSLSGNKINSDYAAIYNCNLLYNKNASISSPISLVIFDNTTKEVNKESPLDVYAILVDDKGNLIEDENISLFIGSYNKTGIFTNESLFKYHFNNLSSLNYMTLVSGNYSGAEDLTVKTGVIEITGIDLATIEMDYLEDNLLINLKDSEGKPISDDSVSVIINNETYLMKTDSNGQVKVPINESSMIEAIYDCGYGLNVSSSMAIKIIEKNNTVYVNQTVEKIVYVNQTVEVPVEVEKIVYVNKTIEVPVVPNRAATKIAYSNMTTVAVAKVDGRIGKYFEVTLIDSKGKVLADKPISIGFNGAVYNRVTNATGGAKLQINLGYEGKYTFAIAFLGDDNYTGSFEVALIEVTKHSPKLSAAAKTFKASAKTKTLTTTFKSANENAIAGKKISFTVNGKTYTGTTNSKGIASVKISLNKKGTFSCTAKYAGDGMYKTTSTKFNVKIV